MSYFAVAGSILKLWLLLLLLPTDLKPYTCLFSTVQTPHTRHWLFFGDGNIQECMKDGVAYFGSIVMTSLTPD